MDLKILSQMHKRKVKHLGEKEIIKNIGKFMPKNQTSDDCAFLKINKEELLINTDLMVEDTHFTDKIISPLDLGWKVLTTNFSDLLSSGCTEIFGIKIGLVLTPDTNWDWIEELYIGMNEALKEYGGNILGGDISRGKQKIISITAFGKQGKLKLRRYGAKPKEIILTTGFHGLSKLGLLLMINNKKLKGISNDQNLKNDAIEAFKRPKPNFSLLNKILIAKDNDQKTVIGCTDSSDGFYQALLDISIESKCKAIIDYKKLPKIESWPCGNKWDEYYFFGGEDYQLILSLPRIWADNLLKIEPTIKEVGIFEEGTPTVEITNHKDNRFLSGEVYSHF